MATSGFLTTKVKPECSPECPVSSSDDPPAPTTSTSANPTAPRRKRKYRTRARPKSPETIDRLKRVRRGKANDRERNRMHSLNDALEHLRTVLPAVPDDNKPTKIETLRMALNYIGMLQEILKLPEGQLPQLSQDQICSISDGGSGTQDSDIYNFLDSNPYYTSSPVMVPGDNSACLSDSSFYSNEGSYSQLAYPAPATSASVDYVDLMGSGPSHWEPTPSSGHLPHPLAQPQVSTAQLFVNTNQPSQANFLEQSGLFFAH